MLPGFIAIEPGRRGTLVAVIIIAGSGNDNAGWCERNLRVAQPHLLRIVGPMARR